jgi:hypothetical protein
MRKTTMLTITALLTFGIVGATLEIMAAAAGANSTLTSEPIVQTVLTVASR